VIVKLQIVLGLGYFVLILNSFLLGQLVREIRRDLRRRRYLAQLESQNEQLLRGQIAVRRDDTH
jgi:hypothetical protein